MSLFCCTKPRGYSSASPSEVELNPRIPTPVPPCPSPGTRRKPKWASGPGRRHSKQDIEAFYQEGKRLQQEEELLELCGESLVGHVCTEDDQVIVGEPSHSLVGDRDDDAMGASSLEKNSSPFVQLNNHKAARHQSEPIFNERKSTSQSELRGGLGLLDDTSCPRMAHQVIPAKTECQLAGSLQLQAAYAPHESEDEQELVGLEKENSIQLSRKPLFGSMSKNPNLQGIIPTPMMNTMPSMPGAFTPGYPGYSISEISITRPIDAKELFFKIPKLLEPSSSSLATRSTSPSKTFRTSISDDMESDRTPKARGAGKGEGTPGLVSPSHRITGKGENSKVHLDNSSSYYASEASSLKSSVDLPTAPVPPISAGMLANISRCFSTGELPKPTMVTGQPSLSGLQNVPSHMSGRRIVTSPQSQHKRLGRQSPIPRIPEPKRYSNIPASAVVSQCDEHIGNDSHVTIEPREEKKILDKGNEGHSTIDCEFSAVKDGSSIWECDPSRRPLLSENGITFGSLLGKKWEDDASAEEPGFWKSTVSKKNNIATSVDDVRFWLEEQHEIGTIQHSPVEEKKSRSLTFKKTFTQSMSKLRSRLSSNLKATGSMSLTVPGASQKSASDGRGNFTRLHTPTGSASISTEKNTNLSDFIDISTEDFTPNSEQLMASIAFSPSIPQGSRMDGSGEDYADFQGAEQSRHTPEANMEAPDVDKIGDAIREKTENPTQHRYSAIYDDCVIFPFGDDVDEDDDASATNSDLITPCTFSTASEMQS